MKTTRLIACAVALIGAQTAAQANLITNGSFTSSLSGWTPSGQACSTQVDWQNVGGANAGVARLNACGEPTTDPTITQLVSGLTIGASYLLSWDNSVHVASSGDNAAEFAALINGTVLLGTNNTSNGWLSYSATFVASATSQSIAFSAERLNTDTSYYVDNISLVAVTVNTVPEPGSLVLAGLAFAALACRPRRR